GAGGGGCGSCGCSHEGNPVLPGAEEGCKPKNEGGGGGKEGESEKGTKLPRRRLIAPPAKRGDAPGGEGGKPVELHHRGQEHDSPLDEMTREDHRGKGNFKKNHSNTGQEPSKINRSKWKSEQKAHWREEWDSGRFENF